MENISRDTEHHIVVVTPKDAGGRLDAVLAMALDGLSRTRIKELVLAGAATLNGAVISEPKYRVKSDDTITLVAPPPIDPEPAGENIPLTVLYEDNALIVINKPAGLVVHPAPGTPSGTLVNALIHHCGKSLAGIGGVRRPGIVHRLDKNTTGVMVAAKTEQAMTGLSAQFADHGRTRTLRRAYRAFAWGHIRPAGASIDAPLGRDPRNRLKQAVRHNGRHAVTHYRVINHFGTEQWAITGLQCRLETGRTHQIRVHMAHIGAPLIADPLYGAGFATKANRLPQSVRGPLEALGRQALHAGELGFSHPVSGEAMLFKAPLPADLARLLNALAPFGPGKPGE